MADEPFWNWTWQHVEEVKVEGFYLSRDLDDSWEASTKSSTEDEENNDSDLEYDLALAYLNPPVPPVAQPEEDAAPATPVPQ